MGEKASRKRVLLLTFAKSPGLGKAAVGGNGESFQSSACSLKMGEASRTGSPGVHRREERRVREKSNKTQGREERGKRLIEI